MPKLFLSKEALAQNYRLLKARTNGALIPVLKADAYGHGAVFALDVLLGEGAELFAVATAYEARELLEYIKISNQEFTNPRILVMGAVEEKELLPLVLHGAILSVHSPCYARFLSRTMALYKESLLLPERASLPVHLKLETGMHRTGLAGEDSVTRTAALPHLSVTGVYSHLGCASDEARAQAQYRRFLTMSAPLSDGLFTHLAASEGFLRWGDFSLSAVRVGLALYGVLPEEMPLPLQPVMRFCARVIAVFRVKAGAFVGYGSLRTDKARRLAVIDAGYADGIPPTASRHGRVFIKGRECRFFGAVCMDRSTLDVGDLSLHEGEEITLFGASAGDTARFAKAAGVTPYVLLSLRSKRTERIYTE